MQDTDTAFTSSSATSRKEDIRVTPPYMPKSHAQASKTGDALSQPGWIRRLLSFLAGFMPFRRQAASRRDELLDAVVNEKSPAHAGHDAPSIAFRGSTASTLLTPLGAYAGKTVSVDTRKAAEKQFHALQSSEGQTIN